MASVFDSTGLTVNGFADELAELIALYQSAFGTDIKTSADSVFGQIINIDALSLTKINELAESVAQSFNPQTASGAALSSLVLLNGIQRQESAYSTTSLTFTAVATKTTSIPAGTQVSDSLGNIFATDSLLEITVAGGSGSVSATAIVAGSVSVAANQLTTIVNPIYGLSSVTNPAAVTEGQTEESDAALRIRRQIVAERSSSVSVSALFQAITDVTGVTDVKINQNTTSTTDADGVPAHSVWCIVNGGSDADVAEAIFDHLAVGIGTYGSEAVSHTDSVTGDTYTINFGRPSDVTIWCIVNLTVDDDYPTDGDEQIEDAIVSYFDENFNLGDDIIHSRLYTPVNSVSGHDVDSIYIDIAASPASTSNISIDDDETGVITTARITVNS